MFELVPYVGAQTLDRIKRDLDSLFSRLWEGGDLPASWREERLFVPSVDVRETDEAIEVKAEMPGLKPEDIEVTLNGDVLTIKGEKKEENEEKKGDYHLVERRWGKFQRSFRLPVEVDRDGLSAVHKDGVLTITLPKAAKETPTKVEIKSA